LQESLNKHADPCLLRGLKTRGKGLSELLSALILLSISIAVAFLLVYALPTASPPETKPWLRPTLIAAFKDSGEIYLYNPHSENIEIMEVWSGGSKVEFWCWDEETYPNPDQDRIIEPRTYEVVVLESPPASSSVLIRFDTGAWMEVRFD